MNSLILVIIGFELYSILVINWDLQALLKQSWSKSVDTMLKNTYFWNTNYNTKLHRMKKTLVCMGVLYICAFYEYFFNLSLYEWKWIIVCVEREQHFFKWNGKLVIRFIKLDVVFLSFTLCYLAYIIMLVMF